jgi:hypothetical protein
MVGLAALDPPYYLIKHAFHANLWLSIRIFVNRLVRLKKSHAHVLVNS